jgi:hypothetical protein
MAGKTSKVALRLMADPRVERLERDPNGWLWICTLRQPFRTERGLAVITESSCGWIEKQVKKAREWNPGEVTVIPASKLPAWIAGDLDLTGLDPQWALSMLRGLSEGAQDYYLSNGIREVLEKQWRDEEWRRNNPDKAKSLDSWIDALAGRG